MGISVNTVEKGAERYLKGDIPPFDQKNEMFKRVLWDEPFRDLGRRFYFGPVLPKKKPGYELKDQALVNASWHLEDLCLSAKDEGGGKNLYARDWDGQFSFPRVPAGLKIEDTDPVRVTRDIKKVAGLFGASLVGVARLDRRWLYSASYFVTKDGGVAAQNHIPEEYKTVIVLGIEMDYDAILYSPAHPASAAVGTVYSKMAFTAGLLAQFIRGMGYQAIPAGNHLGLSIPMAIDAGLGEIARNGLLITPQFGPRLRIAKVFTDIDLVPDRPIEFGVRQFCEVCKKCAKKCPSKSIDAGPPSDRIHNISNREGVNTWHINAETCLSFWADNGTDCSNCIRVCPFNKLPGLFHDTVRWGINRVRPLNRLYLWGDDLLGYGRRKSVKKFWG